MYSNLKETVITLFDNPSALNDKDAVAKQLEIVAPAPISPVGPHDLPLLPNLKANKDTKIMKSSSSFKVITDCPIIVVMMIQAHKQFVPTNLPKLVSIVVEALQVQPAAQEAAHEAARAHNKHHVGIAPAVTQKQLYTDLIVCQVKTLSFLAYIVRGFQDACRNFAEVIPSIVLRLLCNVPSDCASTRKELLVATRHIWSTPFRTAFASHVDQLLLEDVLIGGGLTARDTLRPIAFNMLADFLHHEREKLTSNQILRSIELFCKNMHDLNFSHMVLTISVKLLVALQEAVVQAAGNERTQARAIVLHILSVFCAKLVSLSQYVERFRSVRYVLQSSLISTKSGAISVPKSTEAGTMNSQSSLDQATGDSAVFQDAMDVDSEGKTVPVNAGEIDFEASRPLKTQQTVQPSTSAGTSGNREKEMQQERNEIRMLLRHLIGHLRHIVSTLRLCSIPLSSTSPQQTSANYFFRANNQEETELFRTILRCSIECFEYYWMEIPHNNLASSGQDIIFSRMGSQAKEEKEILDQLSSVFIYVDPAMFQEVFASNLEFLFDCMMKDTSLLAVPQFLLGIEHISQRFNGLLLSFLMDRLPDLGAGDALRSAIMLRLFKLVFMAVTHYPEQNERTLLPHLSPMITQCLKLSGSAKESINYFLLLRALFRSIGGGRFELLYKEVLPLLPILLVNLNHLLTTARSNQMKELFVELCLTVPVRLSVLLPYLSHLMTPLVLALKAGPDLVSQGLRTLELCIDNLTQEFLDPIMSPVIDDLMQALWKHLKPLPYNQQHAHATMRILGKLGGRNRKRLKWVQEGNRNMEILSFKVQAFLNNATVDIDLCDFIQHSLTVMESTSSEPFYLHRAYLFLKHVIEEKKMDVPSSVLCGIFLAAHSEVEGAKDFLNEITCEFKTMERIDSFLDAIVNVMTNETLELREIGKAQVSKFFENNVTSKEASSAFKMLAFKFSSCCFRDSWYEQTGGCFGIATCVSLSVPTKWLIDHQLDFVRALLYLLKSSDSSMYETPKVQESLHQLLKICNRPDPDSDDEKCFQSLISLLISELASSSSQVRETVQMSLQLLADLTGNDVTELLSPSKDRLLVPIFAKPLRALPLPVQIGHTDAITYCLSLRPPLLEFNEELLRLLAEALALADAEDQALGVTKVQLSKNTVSLIKLRIVCIQLLSAAMACSEFQLPRQNATRSRIISVFFKALYNSSQEVVDVAYKAMHQVLAQNHRLPKELLQNGLKPILSTLADHTRLTVPALEGLGRLLELLTNYFKVEIGRKLLDHLRAWSTPTFLEECAGRCLSGSTEIKIIAALINVFSQLPPTASVFLNDLVVEVVRLETSLRRSESSPFRKPLARFMNRYPSESAEYFFSHLADPVMSQLFIGILKLKDQSVSLRVEVAKSIPRYFSSEHSPLSLSHCEVLFRLAYFELEVLKPDIFHHLPELPKTQTHTFSNAFVCLARLYCLYLKVPAVRPEAAFKLCEWLTKCSENFLKHYIYQSLYECAVQIGWDEIFTLLVASLNRFDGSCVPILHYIILPATQYHLAHSRETLELPSEAIKLLLSLSTDRVPDLLVLEILQLLSFLILQMAQQMLPFKNEVIMFSWNFVSSSELCLKHAAHALLSIVTAAYEVPSRLAFQIFGSLVKAHQIETRTLVRQALDVLVPVLDKRLDESVHGKRYQLLKRVLQDESLLPQIVHVFQIVVSHADLFYDVRDEFYPHVASSLPKLCVAQSSSQETRVLTLELIQAIVRWEQRRKREEVESNLRCVSEGGMDIDINDSYPSNVFKDSVISCLVRFACLQEQPQQRGLGTRSIELLRELLTLWPNSTFKLSILEKPILQYPIQEDTVSLLCRPLDILTVALDFDKQKDALRAQEAFRLSLRILKSDLAVSFSPSLSQLFTHIFSYDGLDQSVLNEVSTFINETFNAGARLSLTIDVLACLACRDPIYVHPHLASLLKCMHHELVSHFSDKPRGTDSNQTLQKCITLLNNAMGKLSVDQRRAMVNAIAQIIEKSTDIQLCRFLLEIVREWVTNPEVIYPSMREKSGILVKMMAFEHKGNRDLVNDYLRLVATVLEQKNEVSSRLEQVFLMGTRAETVEIRRLFLDILNQSLPSDLVTRLEYIFSIQNWEPLSSTYFIHQALDVVLGAIEMPAQIHEALMYIHHYDSTFAHSAWIKILGASWTSLSTKERYEFSKSMIKFLTNDYHRRQCDQNPNVIATMLEGIARCRPLPKLAPHVIKHLGKTFNAWHAAIEILTVSQSTLGGTKEEDRLRESTLDALCELLMELNEVDMHTGLWRRRCQYPETNAALSFQQIGYWQRAQDMYEQAQSKGRTGTLGFSESEYCLWEDQWVRCCQKLQQWDVLEDVGKNEGRHDLTLEAIWRLGDWTSGGKDKTEVETLVSHLPEAPRSKVFHAFVALNRLAERKELEEKQRVQEFQAVCDEGVQMALKQWHFLPHAVSDCHVHLLALFQQFVELGEALQIYTSLSNTNVNTYEQRASELKAILQTWRERLPNVWDDVDVWSDLVAWRQHIFGAINKAYFPILTVMGNNAASASAYRGYHETAWIINRFAHVARLHGLTSVCIQYLPKIYTLPNIEIQEAFLKLREQAKCYLSNPAEYKTGLDVINNTNLVYFNPQQKAEFFALKGQFLDLLGQTAEGNQAFAMAVSTDSNLAKSWAAWGEHHDELLKTQGYHKESAEHALNCYLHTIGKLKTGKARLYIARALWLLSTQDKEALPLTAVLKMHQNDLAIWYWLTFIPQLLNMLADPQQTHHAKYLLDQIAKMYPQALHFPLRTLKEELQQESVDEVMATLKSTSPFLALSMETMVDQLISCLKPLPQEEMYRYVVVCLNEMVEHVCSTVDQGQMELDESATSIPMKSLNKLSDHFSRTPALSQYHSQFQRDFIDGSPNLLTIIDRFRTWRDQLQLDLDQYRVPEHLSHYLIEFEHQRLDEVEIPGQYLALVDSPQNFLRINRFRPEIERIRMDGSCHRGIYIMGHDGSARSFLVQQPAPSMYRREERVVQLFGYLNSILDQSRESRKRSIQFHFPTVVPLAPNVRMLSYDAAYTSLEQVWTSHCKRVGIPKDHAMMYYLLHLKEQANKEVSTKMEILEEIRRQFAPADLLERFMLDQVTNFTDLWMLRKQFISQMASLSFMSFSLAIALRYPQSIHISTTTGNIWMSEALPSVVNHKFCHFESVPFRLTPVLQHFITPHGLDGPFSATLLAISKALCLDEKNGTMVEDYLRVIVRDELLYWANGLKQPFASDELLRTKVLENCHEIVGRMQKLVEDCVPSSSTGISIPTDKVDPINRHLLELVARATNPQNLAEMSVTWMPFL
jgi:transformation/transcription domain-associated protein